MFDPKRALELADEISAIRALIVGSDNAIVNPQRFWDVADMLRAAVADVERLKRAMSFWEESNKLKDERDRLAAENVRLREGLVLANKTSVELRLARAVVAAAQGYRDDFNDRAYTRMIEALTAYDNHIQLANGLKDVEQGRVSPFSPEEEP